MMRLDICSYLVFGGTLFTDCSLRRKTVVLDNDLLTTVFVEHLDHLAALAGDFCGSVGAPHRQ
jgi:hypothetical protein